MIKILKETLLNILIGIFIGSVLIFIGMFSPSIKSYYEYVDFDNNKGIAERCFYESHSGLGGGQGSPICRLEDGTIKLVKEYKYVEEKDLSPIEKLRLGEYRVWNC